MKKEKIIAIIIARGGSKSIPRKNILPLRGKPLIAWPIDLAKSVKRIDRIIVSTDDDEIATMAKKYGAEVPFKRPAHLAKDETPAFPVVHHCIKYLEDKENYHPDIIILLFPTSPFLKKERLEESLDLFEKTNCNSVIGIIEDKGRFWKYSENEKKYLPFYPKERLNRQYYKSLYKEDGSIYFSRYSVWMEMSKPIDENSVEFVLMEQGENVDIDLPIDFNKAEKRKL